MTATANVSSASHVATNITVCRTVPTNPLAIQVDVMYSST